MLLEGVSVLAVPSDLPSRPKTKIFRVPWHNSLYYFVSGNHRCSVRSVCSKGRGNLGLRRCIFEMRKLSLFRYNSRNLQLTVRSFSAVFAYSGGLDIATTQQQKIRRNGHYAGGTDVSKVCLFTKLMIQY